MRRRCRRSPLLRKLPQLLGQISRRTLQAGIRSRHTAVDAGKLQEITDKLTTYPDDFAIHPKVQKLLEQREEMGYGKLPLDYGMAEALAFGSLAGGRCSRAALPDRTRVAEPSTIATRCLIDTENEKEYVPLCHIRPGQARFEIYNSIFLKPRCWASNMASAATILTALRCGKRSSATSPTARRSSSTSLLWPVKTNGDLLSGLVHVAAARL